MASIFHLQILAERKSDRYWVYCITIDQHLPSTESGLQRKETPFLYPIDHCGRKKDNFLLLVIFHVI
ncbi:hypothetical protein HMPREF1141_1539 [Clostridium sp. MSTE9]|jgi:hypothetical protein|nr:hypothetical protein HMPREF1141_1539 [Clostridium sp. MSTE9]